MEKGYYLYAIGEDAGKHNHLAEVLSQTPGVDSKLHLQEAPVSGLRAFFSEVSLAEFGQDAIKRNLQNMEWLEKKARAHDAIVKRISEFATIVPVRFGTVFTSMQNLNDSLQESAQQLRDLLKTFHGYEEMGVTLNFDKRQVSKYVERTDPQLAKLSKKAGEGGSGSAYLMRKKIELDRQKKLGSFIDDCVSAVTAKLNKKTKEVKQSALLAVPEDRSQVYVNIACLIPEADLDTFTEEAMNMPELPSDSGVSVRVTGPWPPYSFATFQADNSQKNEMRHAS